MDFFGGARELGTNLAAFIVVLGLMIFFHEFGHFITAKAFGMRVFIFSFGFGRRLLGFKWGDTDCRVSLIPLGGYVKLEGEPEDHLSEDTSTRGDAKDFTGRPRWQRFVVYLAGPVMNGVLTVGVLTLLYMTGFQVDAMLHDRPYIGAVDPGSPGEAAGLQPGDEILAIDGKAQPNWEEAKLAVLLRPGQLVRVRIRRNGAEQDVEVKASSEGKERGHVGTIGVHPLVRVGEVVPGAPADQAGLKADDAILRIGDKPIRSFTDIPDIVRTAEGKPLALTVWREGQVLQLTATPRNDGPGVRIGIAPKFVEKRLPLRSAFTDAVRWTATSTRQTFDVLKRLLTARLSPKTMMGPLQIAQAAGDAARVSTDQLFFLVAVISLQIGIMNLFPLPPLDGGHLAILAGESLLRRDFSVNAKTWLMNAGAMVLFLLIGLVLYSDLSKTSLLGKYLP
jgi:regulator of sigma E protease